MGAVLAFKQPLTRIYQQVNIAKEQLYENLENEGFSDSEIESLQAAFHSMDTNCRKIFLHDKLKAYSNWSEKTQLAFYEFLIQLPSERLKKVFKIDFNKFEHGKVPINYLTAVLRSKTEKENYNDNINAYLTNQYADIKEIFDEFKNTNSKDFDDIEYIMTSKFLKIQKELNSFKMNDADRSKFKEKVRNDHAKFNKWLNKTKMEEISRAMAQVPTQSQ